MNTRILRMCERGEVEPNGYRFYWSVPSLFGDYPVHFMTKDSSGRGCLCFCAEDPDQPGLEGWRYLELPRDRLAVKALFAKLEASRGAVEVDLFGTPIARRA